MFLLFLQYLINMYTAHIQNHSARINYRPNYQPRYYMNLALIFLKVVFYPTLEAISSIHHGKQKGESTGMCNLLIKPLNNDTYNRQ